MEKKTLYLNVTIFIISVIIGAGTILAVKADDFNYNCEESERIDFYIDADSDGYGDATGTSTAACSAPSNYVANNTDCDDDNANINPGELEICDVIDNNCDGQINEGIATYTYYIDEDGDNFGTNATTTIFCSLPAGFSANASDCNDFNASIKPGATELCDGIDNDCDGSIDEGLATTTYYRDIDGDGYGTSATTTTACSLPAGYSANASDCNDFNASIKPGATELCDGIDNDCDGTVDESCTTMHTYYRDADGDGYGNPSITISAASQPSGYVANDDDCNDANASIKPGATELCDGIDNDCDGSIDEGLATITYYRDIDGDGYGTSATTTLACSKPTGYSANASDCNDNNAAIHPGAAELCDGLDNDCDGTTDEGCTAMHTYYRDADGDTYGNPNKSTSTASQPSGYVANDDDCNDDNASIKPGATELCDGIDNDCDGQIDEGCTNDFVEPGACPGYKNHGQFVSAWAHWTNMLKKMGEITGREKGQMMSQRAKSGGDDCPNDYSFEYQYNYNNAEDNDDGEEDEDDDDQGKNNNNKFKTKNKGNNNK